MNHPERLLIFDLKGPVGHFRKFYTNTSSLTYLTPPRTTLAGLIAGILGRERDSFHEEFDPENCGIGLSLRGGVRKLMQTVNYIRTKSNDGYSSFEGALKHAVKGNQTGYPTPLEIVFPVRPEKELIYRIYFSHKDEAVFTEATKRIKSNQYVYPPYLGLSEFLGEIRFVATVCDKNNIHTGCVSDGFIQIATVCAKEMISELDFEQKDMPIHYIEERMPILLGENRTIKKKGNFITTMNGQFIRAKLNSDCLKISYTDSRPISENITFLK